MVFLLLASDVLIGIRRHSLTIKVFLLDDVADVELDDASLLLVVHPEVVPIGVAFGVGITAHEAVELILLYSHCDVQIATFEVRAKRDFVLPVGY